MGYEISDGAKVDYILLGRFRPFYFSWFGEHIPRTVGQLLRCLPEPGYVEEEKRPSGDDAWHARRVRYFYDELRAGRSLTPILVDCECRNSRIYPEPVLVDGHHRFAAYVFAKRRVVPAYYGGRVDVLEYLTGQRRALPKY